MNCFSKRPINGTIKILLLGVDIFHITLAHGSTFNAVGCYVTCNNAYSLDAHKGQIVILAFGWCWFQDDDVPFSNGLGNCKKFLVTSIAIIMLAFPDSIFYEPVKLWTLVTKSIAGKPIVLHFLFQWLTHNMPHTPEHSLYRKIQRFVFVFPDLRHHNLLNSITIFSSKLVNYFKEMTELLSGFPVIEAEILAQKLIDFIFIDCVSFRIFTH